MLVAMGDRAKSWAPSGCRASTKIGVHGGNSGERQVEVEAVWGDPLD